MAVGPAPAVGGNITVSSICVSCGGTPTLQGSDMTYAAKQDANAQVPAGTAS